MIVRAAPLLQDEQLPLGTVKGADESSEEAYAEKPLPQTGYEPNFTPAEGDVRRAYT